MTHQKRVGGNLERALNDNHTFNPIEVLKEGVRLTKHSLTSLLGAVVVSLAIFTVVLMVLIQVFIGPVELDNPQVTLAMLVAQIIVMPPLFAGIHLMGILHSVGQRTQVQDVFRFIKQPFPFILVALITQIISQLAAGVLPGVIAILALLFISVTLSMAIPLVAEYKLSPWQAIRCSFIAIMRRFLPFVTIYAALFGLFVLGILTFGIGLIFVVPLFYNVKGILYRDIFGVAVEGEGTAAFAADSTDHESSNKDTWSA